MESRMNGTLPPLTYHTACDRTLTFSLFMVRITIQYFAYFKLRQVYGTSVPLIELIFTVVLWLSSRGPRTPDDICTSSTASRP